LQNYGSRPCGPQSGKMTSSALQGLVAHCADHPTMPPDT
jgi:hypothetical protein